MILSWLRKRKARQFNEAKGWLWAGAVTEQQAGTGWPADFWRFDWHDCGVVRLLDPLYGKQKVLREYWVFDGDMRYAFATPEFSNGIYGFFLPSTGGIKDIGADPKLRDLSNVPRHANGDPHFPYFDAAALPPLLSEAEGSCMACGKQQERLYQGPLYTRCSR